MERAWNRQRDRGYVDLPTLTGYILGIYNLPLVVPLLQSQPMKKKAHRGRPQRTTPLKAVLLKLEPDQLDKIDQAAKRENYRFRTEFIIRAALRESEKILGK